MQSLSRSYCDGVAAPVHWTGERLDSWKEIASFFRREVRTVQLWEKTEGLPVRRQNHKKLGSVYAYRREIEAWWIARSAMRSNCTPAMPRSRQHGNELMADQMDANAPRILLLPLEVTNCVFERGSVRESLLRFAEGLREDLISEMRRFGLTPIFVPAKTVCFPESSSPAFLKQMAREFKAGFVATGSIRVSEAQAHVSVQLIRGEDSTCAWSERFELGVETLRGNQSGLAVRISQAVAQESVRLPKARKPVDVTSHPPAYHACRMGFHFWNQRSKSALLKALNYFEDAIDLDPACAEAFAGLADTYISLSYNHLLPSQPAATLAGAAVEQAMRLDCKSLAVQNALINLLINCTWDHGAAERRCLQLIDSGRMDTRTLQLYSTLMNSEGRHDEAIALALHGHRIEPLSDLVNGQVAVAYFYAGDYVKALSFVHQTIKVQPQFLMGHALLGRIEAERGNWDQAIDFLSRGMECSHRSPSMLALLAYSQAGAGNVDAADELLQELEDSRSGDCFPAYDVSAVYAILDRETEALQEMSKAYEKRDMKTIFLRHDPRFRGLSHSEDFQRIASSISAA